MFYKILLSVYSKVYLKENIFMGKAKKRNFEKCRHLYTLSLNRKEAIDRVLGRFRCNVFDSESKSLISLFGLSQEELSESGASWEAIEKVDKFITQYKSLS